MIFLASFSSGVTFTAGEAGTAAGVGATSSISASRSAVALLLSMGIVRCGAGLVPVSEAAVLMIASLTAMGGVEEVGLVTRAGRPKERVDCLVWRRDVEEEEEVLEGGLRGGMVKLKDCGRGWSFRCGRVSSW